ncbi:MAG: FAD-dependent oxidoreductase [Candidatus Nanopelagicales bacterium]
MSFQRNVVRKGGAGYEHTRRYTAFSERVPERYPEVIVEVRDVDDVVAAINIAKDEDRKISVRSGGHHWNASHLRDGAVLIDMHNMTDYAVDTDAMTAWAEPGLRGSDLNKALQEIDLFFPTGHCTDVSIGGFLLQGGVCWDNHRYGPSCGHVYAVDVVTADGEQVHATDDNEYSDLLWAARGAGAGFFGFVVKYHIKLYPRRLAVNSLYIYPSRLLEDVFAFTQKVGPDTPTEINMLTFWNEELDTEAPVIALNAMSHADTEEPGPSHERTPGRATGSRSPATWAGARCSTKRSRSSPNATPTRTRPTSRRCGLRSTQAPSRRAPASDPVVSVAASRAR